MSVHRRGLIVVSRVVPAILAVAAPVVHNANRSAAGAIMRNSRLNGAGEAGFAARSAAHCRSGSRVARGTRPEGVPTLMTKPARVPGSKRSRDLGCLVTALAFFAVGALFGSFFAVHAWRDVRVFTVWRPTSCTIVAKELGSSGGSGSSRPSYRPQIAFRYEVRGKEYTCSGWDSWALSGGYGGGSAKYYERVLDRYEIGSTYPCWYDPADPSKAVLVRRLRALYVLAVLPLAFTFLGAVGIFATLAKPNRRRGNAAKAEARARSQAGHQRDTQAASGIHHLAVRLDPDTKPGTQSCGALFVSMALLFVGAIAGYSAWSEWQDGNVSLFLLMFTAVFGGLGLLFLWIAAASGLASEIPETVAEIERRSIAPGEDVDVMILQPGPLRLRSLRVRLVCKEETPAERGSPDVTVLRDELVSEVGPTTIGRQVPLEYHFRLRIPPDARASRGDPPPRVRWRLEVWCVPKVWPRFMLAFPIMVEGTKAGAPAGRVENAETDD